ncbi:Ssh4 protein [Maudiozyma humilis]|uniref:Ssh4 protein n=1 Tax=Maudiozyma humilis TaxID=51915 RepID=A0AAV5RQW5_MAUHU|nr:Ssh4 protein [Kazachstania humilis]
MYIPGAISFGNRAGLEGAAAVAATATSSITRSAYESGIPTLMPPGDTDPETISVAFLISLSITFLVLMTLVLIIATYITFCAGDENEYDEEMANSRRRINGGRLRNINRPFQMFFSGKHSDALLESVFEEDGDIVDGKTLEEREKEAFKRMSAFEVELYIRAKELQKMAPPVTDEFGSYLDTSDTTFIKDRGIQAFFFLPSINDNIDKIGHFLPSFLIQDKLDILFTKYNRSSSTVMNYPLPYNKRDAVYFEVKVYRHQANSNTVFSVGLSTVPYPYFRIPGMAKFSIAYESTGKLRINNPFEASTLLPKLQEGDVVGFGFKFKTGTIFVTHNGKRLMDVTQNVDIDLFPCIGAMNASYTRTYSKEGLMEDPDNVDLRQAVSEGKEIDISPKLERVHDAYVDTDNVESDEVELQVNIGQLGFVFIEANVKKYKFNSLYGQIGIPPTYSGSDANKDTLLQKGEEFPPAYPENLETTYGSHSQQGSSQSLGHYERISSAFDREHNEYDTPLSGNNHTVLSDIDEETPLLLSTSLSGQGVESNSKLSTPDQKNPAVRKNKKKGKKGKKRKGRGRK